MKVLYVSYDGMTDPLGQSQVIPYLKGLAARGYEITILSCEKPHNLAKNQTLVDQLLSESQIRWEYIFYSNNPPVLSTLFGIRKLKQRAKRLFVQGKFEIVHCRSYLAAFVGLWAKRKYNSKFLFDIRGFWADERLDSGAWNMNSPLYRTIYKYFKRREVELFSNANHVISLTHKAKGIIHSWKHIPNQPLPVEVIPCCADLDTFNSNAIDEIRLKDMQRRIGIKDGEFIISYLGSIGGLYMLEEMLEFFAQLLKRKSDAKFLFITHTPAQEILAKAAKYNLDRRNLIITEASRKEVPLLLKLSSAAIFFIKPTYSKAASSPTKQGEIMGLGIPLICNAGIGDTDLVVEKYNAGLLVKEFSITEYNRILEQLDELLKKDRSRIIRGALDFYSLKDGIARYDKVYRRLAGNLLASSVSHNLEDEAENKQDAFAASCRANSSILNDAVRH